ncbi:MAG: AEC family transporter [Candidatus Hodarchaeota archaeon]
MADVNIVFLLSITIISIGYLIKKLKIIEEKDGNIIAKIIFNLTLPAVILKITSTLNFELSLILLPLINISFGILMAVLGLILFRKEPKNIKGLMIMTVIGFNVAHFSFPLIEGIWGEEGLQIIAMIDAGNAFTIFVLCYIVSSIFSPKNQEEGKKVNLKYVFKRLVKSAPLMSYFIALTINFSGITLPSFIMDLLDIIARANTALSLLLLGIFLNFKFERTEWISIFKVLIIRYLFGLGVGLSLFFFLPPIHFDHLFRIIVAISLILPIGLAVIPFSVEFEYNQRLVTILVNLTIIISFALMWILIIILDG